MSRKTYGRKKVVTGMRKSRTKQTHIYLDNWYFTQTTLLYHLTLISVRVKYIEIMFQFYASTICAVLIATSSQKVGERLLLVLQELRWQ